MTKQRKGNGIDLSKPFKRVKDGDFFCYEQNGIRFCLINQQKPFEYNAFLRTRLAPWERFDLEEYTSEMFILSLKGNSDDTRDKDKATDTAASQAADDQTLDMVVKAIAGSKIEVTLWEVTLIELQLRRWKNMLEKGKNPDFERNLGGLDEIRKKIALMCDLAVGNLHKTTKHRNEDVSRYYYDILDKIESLKEFDFPENEKDFDVFLKIHKTAKEILDDLPLEKIEDLEDPNAEDSIFLKMKYYTQDSRPSEIARKITATQLEMNEYYVTKKISPIHRT